MVGQRINGIPQLHIMLLRTTVQQIQLLLV